MISQNRFTTAQIDMEVWTEEMLDMLCEFIKSDDREFLIGESTGIKNMTWRGKE